MKSTMKWKGRHKIILQELTEDDNLDLYDSSAQILENAAKNKILVDEQFRKFITEEVQQAQTSQKKPKIVTPPFVDPVDLTHTALPPYATQIGEEVILTLETTTSPTITNPYLQSFPAPLRAQLEK